MIKLLNTQKKLGKKIDNKHRYDQIKLMKVVILAGGFGTRISEESQNKPKPMINIGNKPILWHIMKHFSCFGFNEFIICCGYKGYLIKEYFFNYHKHNSNLEVNLKTGELKILDNSSENWKITLVDTGQNTQTAGRLKRIEKFLKNEKNFFFTYGDSIGNINIKKLLDHHIKSKKKVTVTSVAPPGRFGAIQLSKNSNLVKKFIEKPPGDSANINGGFFVINNSVFKEIKKDSDIWESNILPKLVAKKEVTAYSHQDFWYAMDTMRDKKYLNELWISEKFRKIFKYQE